MKKKPKKYTKDSAIPTQPRAVLSDKAETPWEISSRNGLDHRKLCARLIEWHSMGQIVGGHTEERGVRIPLFRLRLAWD